MNALAAFEELIGRVRESALLDSCAVLLGWDEETYMSRAGAEHREKQMALLAGLHHARITDLRIGDLLAVVEGSPLVADPLAPTAVNIREIRWTYDRARRLPGSLVEELARKKSLAQQEWVVARQQADFALFRPWLERTVRLKVCEAEALGFDTSGYEPGARSAELSGLFDSLRRELVPLANAITHARRKADVSIGRPVAAGGTFRAGQVDPGEPVIGGTYPVGGPAAPARPGPRDLGSRRVATARGAGAAVSREPYLDWLSGV